MTAPETTSSRRFGRSQIKLLLRVGLMGMVGIFGIFAVSFVSRAMADITRSEETAAIFNVSAELHHDLVEAVEWRADPAGLPKELAPLERKAITETWLRAWTQFLILSDGSGPVGSAVGGDPTDGIIEYFGGAAEEAMLASNADWLGLPIHQIGHDLQLNFYSDDGSVVSVSSERSRFLRGHPVQGRIEWYDTTETYDAVFVFRDGNWRVHHWVRRSSEGSWATQVDNLNVRPLEVDNIRSVTWVPTGQTPQDFWANPDLVRAEREIAIIDDLGFNTVRIELPFELLGGRDVETADLFPAAALMDIADENDLNVVVKLLADRTEHQPLHWDADDDHLVAVMDTLGDHPALVLWEIGSEPDTHIGIERVEPEMLDAWLTHVGRTVRRADQDTPITIGWSSPRAAAEAPPIADVVSFTWSGDTAGLEAALPYVRDIAGERPILISDASYHTHVGVLPGAQTETEQARFYADMLLAVEDYGLRGFTISTLRDYDVENVAVWAQAEAERIDAEKKARIAEQEVRFPPPPTSEPKEAGPEVHEAPIVAEVTWPVGAEAATGLIRVDGSPKPAAAVFAPDADLDAVPSPSLVETIQKPFNLILLFVASVAISAWIFLILWARNIIRFPKLHVFARVRSAIERNRLPQQNGELADGQNAQQRRRRTRKKVSVTAPIEQQPVAATPVVAAPHAEEAPKEGLFRRVVGWLNAPVLPDDEAVETAAAAVAPANDVAVGQPALAVPQPMVAEPVITQPVITQPGAIEAPIATDPATAEAFHAVNQLDQLVAQQQAQFAAWLAVQQRTLQAAVTAAVPAEEPAPEAPFPTETAPSAVAPGREAPAEDAAPTYSLADALPNWPSDDMIYSDVHDAMFSNEPTTPPPATAMAMTEVDLQTIDSILDEVDAPALDGPTRYAPFLTRALCIAARTVDSDDVEVHVDVAGPNAKLRRIEGAHDKRLSALTRELAALTSEPAALTREPAADADADAIDTPATVIVHVSSSMGGHLRVEIGDGSVPTVSLIRLHKRPIATRDRLGCTAITTHSMGLLSVAASSTPVRADEYLQMLREILETRDWATELD